MKIADEIKYKLMSWCKGSGYEIIIPNFFIGMYEMDVYRLMPSGIIVEYEIKISRSDFKADFSKGDKHKRISSGERQCNRFFFVAPEGVLTVEDMPNYCGLITYNGSSFTMRKNAPLIHKNKRLNDYRDLAQRLSFRESIARDEARWWKSEFNRLNKGKTNISTY